jgi:hypothetical protein
MYLPSVYQLSAFYDIVMRVLGGGEARVVGQDTQAVAYCDPVKCVAVARVDLAMLLRQRRDAHTGFATVEIENAAVAA